MALEERAFTIAAGMCAECEGRRIDDGGWAVAEMLKAREGESLNSWLVQVVREASRTPFAPQRQGSPKHTVSKRPAIRIY